MRTFNRYGLLVRKIRLESGNSLDDASIKMGVPKRDIVGVEDRGWRPSATFDANFRRAFPQSAGMNERLNRFFEEVNKPQFLRKAR
ncbi:hypothetical protein DTI93_08665 [Parasaccharibacter sp. TMW 2.1884]|uniref:hypothetical protein n=1 Tax=Parasaccharibacter sp. TMW 2.1884 TaxID=2267834 RepID=UPI0020116716|nr:hypothetical protein [Parasaccharibacter sp. TMW 2.1884]MCL1512455.1 hypothetical protein [Parasaccharibacter sp. TMW 2.1884]